LKAQSSFPQLACTLRVLSRQLDLTPIFEIANRDLAALFPRSRAPFAHLHHVGHLEEVLGLALQYGVESEVRLVCIGDKVAFSNLPLTFHANTLHLSSLTRLAYHGLYTRFVHRLCRIAYGMHGHRRRPLDD
jgi:hypothetical protein